MRPRERQNRILIILGHSPGKTMQQLADECSVSRRTIIRDIIELSRTELIYTSYGRYSGGVYLADNYSADWTGDQIELMNRLLAAANHEVCLLSSEEYSVVQDTIKRHSIPRVR